MMSVLYNIGHKADMRAVNIKGWLVCKYEETKYNELTFSRASSVCTRVLVVVQQCIYSS